MSSTTSKLANKTKSKSKLHHFGNHTQKQSNEHTKKNTNTKNVSALLRRPMTPSVEFLRYPEPEIILKEIQKNVNVLKEIYEASVIERSGFQAEVLGKKSVPAVNFPISESTDPKKKKSVQEKPQEKIKNLNKSKSQSSENFIKIFEGRRQSIANNREQAETIKNIKRKASNSITEKKEDESCKHLLEIFQFYKRSIDSSISKYSNPMNVHSNMHSNDAKISLLSDNHNYHSIQNKSESKETPHNSSTKIATNHKGSSIDPSFEGEIGGEIWKEDDELICSKRNGVNKGNKERKVFPFQKKTAKDSAKSSRVPSQEEKKQGSKDKVKKQEKKSYNQDLLTKVSKDKITRNDKTKSLKQKPTESGSNDTSRPKKLTKKKPQLIEFEETPFEKPVHKSTLKYDCHEVQKFDFPEIQSSVFNRDMPILEEDSREELSSSMIIAPGNSINSSRYTKNNGESGYKIEDRRESEQHYFLSKRNSVFNQPNITNEELVEKVKKFPCDFILYNSNNKKISQDQNTRFPTPSFVTSELSNEMLQIEMNEKQDEPLNLEDSDGSLAGCEIPKDRSDSFGLEEFETTSFDL